MANYNSKNKDTYCPLAWEHQMVDSDGSYRLCCVADAKIKNQENNPFNIRGTILEEVWNSKYMQDVRHNMLNGNKISDCRRCYRDEEVNDYSYRQRTLAEKNMGVNSYIAPITDDDIIVKKEPSYYDFRLGNLCNLKCRMCNPYASNQWVDEWELIEEWKNPNEKIRLAKMDWPNTPATWTNLEPILDTVKMIYLTGGEPTLAVEQYKLFDICIERGIAKNIISIGAKTVSGK